MERRKSRTLNKQSRPWAAVRGRVHCSTPLATAGAMRCARHHGQDAIVTVQRRDPSCAARAMDRGGGEITRRGAPVVATSLNMRPRHTESAPSSTVAALSTARCAKHDSGDRIDARRVSASASRIGDRWRRSAAGLFVRRTLDLPSKKRSAVFTTRSSASRGGDRNRRGSSISTKRWFVPPVNIEWRIEYDSLLLRGWPATDGPRICNALSCL